MSGLYRLLQEAASGTMTSLPTLHTLAGLTAEQAATFCDVPWTTYRRYLTDRKPPKAVLHLLTLRAGFIQWHDWEKFYYCAQDQLLYHIELKYGFSPKDVEALHWLRGENQALQAELKTLRRKFNALNRRHIVAMAMVQNPDGLGRTQHPATPLRLVHVSNANGPSGAPAVPRGRRLQPRQRATPGHGDPQGALNKRPRPTPQVSPDTLPAPVSTPRPASAG
jgi:hypothetical protein